MRKISEASKLETLKIFGRIAKIVKPISENQDFLTRLRLCFPQAGTNPDKTAGASIMLALAELFLNEQPEAILQIIAAVDGKPEKDAYSGNSADLFEDLQQLMADEVLLNFLSVQLPSAQAKSSSTLTTAAGKAQQKLSPTLKQGTKLTAKENGGASTTV